MIRETARRSSSRPIVGTVAVALVLGLGIGCGGSGDGPSGPGPVTVASVTVSPPLTSVAVGATAQLQATPRDADGATLTGRAVTWSSSDNGKATVSPLGLVTGVAVGDVTITATSEGVDGTADVVITAVAAPVASVEVAPLSDELIVGETLQLQATTKDAGGATLTGRIVTWSSDATGVATVNGNGVVTAVAVGTATITATSEGVNGTAEITVVLPPPMIRTWVGGATGAATAWSSAANWNPAGVPIPADSARIAQAANAAELTGDVTVAHLVITGGRLNTKGHLLRIRAP